MGPRLWGVPASPARGGRVTRPPPAPPAWAWPRGALSLWRKERGVGRGEKTREADTSREGGGKEPGPRTARSGQGLRGPRRRQGPVVREGQGEGQEEMWRDQQPHRAAAGSGPTGPCCLEDGSSWAGHGLFPARLVGYAFLNGVRPEKVTPSWRPGPKPRARPVLTCPTGEEGTDFP